MRGVSVISMIVVLVVLAAVFAISLKAPEKRTGIINNEQHTMNTTSLSLTSSAFADGASIPAQYTCDGEKTLSPALSIAGVPAEAKSLVLIMDDPDIPARVKRPDFQEFDHWILFNIPPETREIAEGASVGTPGANNAGGNAYAAPCPPPQYEPSEHRYIFNLYALDAKLPLEAGATKAAVLAAMQGHVIAQTRLIGRYKRQ